MTRLAIPRRTKAPPGGNVLPLKHGDCMTRDEFERRWDAMPDLCRAELIEGIVYMAAATRAHKHGRPHWFVTKWLSLYQDHTPGVEGFVAPSVRIDPLNEPQPDLALLIPRAYGGQCAVDDDDYLHGVPELGVEIAASSKSRDLGVKKEVYRKSGMREYLVWRVLDGKIDWFHLHRRRFERLPLKHGIYQSRVFPGLWLDVPAMLDHDFPAVRETLQRGLSEPDHEKFCRRLQTRNARDSNA